MKTEQYKQDMSNIDITTTLFEAKCINKVYNEYQEKALRVIDKHAPYKFFSRKEMRWRLRPWLTKGIQNSIKTKNHYYKKFVRTKKQYWYKLYKHHANARASGRRNLP